MFIHLLKQQRKIVLVFFSFLLAATFLYANEKETVKTETVRSNITRKAPYLLFNGNANQMEIHWQLTTTNVCTIKWGTDTTYSIGSAATNEYGSSHQHKYVIDSLSYGTKYYYKVTIGSEEYTGSFYSAPSPSATRLKFFAYGDTRSYPATHNNVAQHILNEISSDPEYQTLVISTGDLISNGESESDWDDEFFNENYSYISQLLASFPFQSARGNHEGNGYLFKKYFPYPYVDSHYWSFDYGPAHFVVIDQYVSYSQNSPQYTWIDNDLANSDKPWKFICLHEPGWTAGGHSNEIPVQRYIQPLCRRHNVPIIFGGHNHYYARAVVDSVNHITTGGGGAPLYTPDPNYPNIVVTSKSHHYCKIELDGDMLYFSAYNISGTRIDTFAIERIPNAITDSEETTPDKYSLLQNYPNPFNPSTVISYTLPALSDVKLEVFNVLGQKVRTLVDEKQNAGNYSVTFSADNLPSGLYIYRLQANGFSQTRKMILLR